LNVWSHPQFISLRKVLAGIPFRFRCGTGFWTATSGSEWSKTRALASAAKKRLLDRDRTEASAPAMIKERSRACGRD
jgi:hypothetical protein